jgi:purine-nucleoside phosphorylase
MFPADDERAPGRQGTLRRCSSPDAPQTVSLLYMKAQESARFIASRIHPGAEIAIICGTGWDGLAKTLDQAIAVDFHEIPHFATTCVPGHAGGQLVSGLWRDRRVICLTSRFHEYEGTARHEVTFPVRVLALLGVKTMIVTNASGALNPRFRVGDLVILDDHISLPCLTGRNPLVGPNEDAWGPRFVDAAAAYDRSWRELAFEVAASRDDWRSRVRRGVYVHAMGPSYETRAESRFLRSIGGDVIGMSTVPEVIVARHCRLRVLGLSLITAPCVAEESHDTRDSSLTHDSVVEAARSAQHLVQELLCELVNRMS